MNNAEKKMKRYVNAVQRKLNLPRDIKTRVISDFVSSIAARREAGQSDEEIYAELGNPKKAAAELNEQMKEFTYRKSPWRFLFAAMAAYGAAELLGGLWVNLMYLWFRFFSSDVSSMNTAETHSIGIIGGADGPTAIFMTAPVWSGYVIACILLVVGIWGFLKLRKCKQK